LAQTAEAVAAISKGLAQQVIDKVLGRRILHAAGSFALIGAVKLRDALVALEYHVAQGVALHQSDAATLQQIWRANREELHRHAQHH
jgi:hypothetical protein